MESKEPYDDKIGPSEFILPSQTVKHAIVGSGQSVGQRLEWLKSDVSFLKDHIKALRAMSVAYLLDFRHECEKKEAFDEIQAGFNYLHKVINELCWLAEAVGYLEEETNYKKLN